MLENKSLVSFSSVVLREIEKHDNLAVEALIRSVSAEFDFIGPGCSSNDHELAQMYEAYSGDGLIFFSFEFKGAILGCGIMCQSCSTLEVDN